MENVAVAVLCVHAMQKNGARVHVRATASSLKMMFAQFVPATIEQFDRLKMLLRNIDYVPK